MEVALTEANEVCKEAEQEVRNRGKHTSKYNSNYDILLSPTFPLVAHHALYIRDEDDATKTEMDYLYELLVRICSVSLSSFSPSRV